MREIAEIELAIQGGTEKIEQLGEQGKVDESMRHDVEMQETSPVLPFAPQTFDTTMQSTSLHPPAMNK